jgi:hypothetical protein
MHTHPIIDVQAVLQGFNPAASTNSATLTISLPEFMKFLGKAYAPDVGAKLRKILQKVYVCIRIQSSVLNR